MTPQLNRLNQDMWANLEAKVRAQICNDTLYVVTGCYYANTNTTTTDRDGKVCPVPTNYFKVLLRTRTGTTGGSEELRRYSAACVHLHERGGD